MPSNVQSILTGIIPLNVTKAAKRADRILEVTPQRRFIPKAAQNLDLLNKFLEGHKNKKKTSRFSKKPENPLYWSDKADNAFILAKQALANAALLKHPIRGAELSLWSDASDVAIGRSLMQLCNVLLCLRTAIKKDLNATSSQIVYNTTLRLPFDLLNDDSIVNATVTPIYVTI
ncbi:hypothetical protein HNY73_011980 [Argiope bruennichi]|uniref:Reverse transcriptase/retrotransposon-derived protein RNase H-like domain-containing protein n=1 Tax=Argiope bruennichi TaxID=94029 RepID=A0A8T0EY91_ARGBR|nr:hypothetical protein HNY73_011980 [Argiope bruennichi]